MKVIITLASLALLAFYFVRSPHTDAPSGKLELPRSVSVVYNGGFGTLQAHLAANEPDYKATVSVGASRQKVTLATEEQDGYGVWHQSSSSYSVSFTITRIAHVTSHVLVFAGYGPRGGDVIESLSIPVQDGEMYTARLGNLYPVDCQPPQVWGPLGLSPTELEISGSFVIPSARGARRTPARCQIYSGDLDGIVDFDADPDGRFVVVLGGADSLADRKLYQIPMHAGADPAVVLDPAAEPLLISAGSLAIREHATHGRLVEITGLALDGVQAVIGFDSDNDGTFEAFNHYDPTGYAAAGFLDNWVNL